MRKYANQVNGAVVVVAAVAYSRLTPCNLVLRRLSLGAHINARYARVRPIYEMGQEVDLLGHGDMLEGQIYYQGVLKDR